MHVYTTLITPRYFDLPRKPKWAVGVSSVQNHGRGSETLTAKVHQAQAKKKGERRRSSFSKEKEGEGEVEEEEGGGSIRDHPSLRMRRKSWDEVSTYASLASFLAASHSLTLSLPLPVTMSP